MAISIHNSALFDSDLQFYYKFDETGGTTVTDSSLSGINGTASRTNILNVAGGKFGNMGAFVAASSDKVTFTDNAVFKPTGAFSISGWVKTGTTGTDKCIFNSYCQAGSKYAGILVAILTGTNGMAIQSAKNTGTTSGLDWKTVSGAVNVCDNAWHHFVCLWDTGNLKIYVDGAADGTDTWANAPAYQATNYVRIGCLYTTSETWFMNGNIDELALWDRALTLGEIQYLYYSSVSSRRILIL